MNYHKKSCLTIFASTALVLSSVLTVLSQPMDQGTEIELQGTVFSIYDTDFDDGGSISMNHYGIALDLKQQLSEQLETGIGVKYVQQDYDFSGGSGFSVLNPWEEIHIITVSTSLAYAPGQDWSIRISPFVQSSAESGSDDSESYSYGGLIFASYAYSRDLILGFGGGVTSGLEETEFIPALYVRWQINNKLLLTNPTEAGPSGPAGLELSYALSPQWNIGVGAAYRSYRFRLDDEDVAPDGIGEFSGVPAWLRASWQPTDFTTLALYGGYTFAGEIELEDRDGNSIANDDYDPAPFAAASLEITF